MSASDQVHFAISTGGYAVLFAGLTPFIESRTASHIVAGLAGAHLAVAAIALVFWLQDRRIAAKQGATKGAQR